MPFTTGQYGRLSPSIDFIDVPHALLETTQQKLVIYKAYPADKNLIQLLKPFLSKDALRPAMMGIYFAGHDIVATDGHRMVVLPILGYEKPAIYSPDGRIIDERYPEYQNAIPQLNKKTVNYTVTCRALRSYLQATLPFIPKNAAHLAMKQGTSWLGFNAKYLIEAMLLFEKLGYSTVVFHVNEDVQFHNLRAVIISPKPYVGLGTQPMVLQMPTNLASYANQPVQYPANLDLHHELRAYWSLDQNTVIGLDERPFTFSSATAMWNTPPTPSDRVHASVWTWIQNKPFLSGKRRRIDDHLCKIGSNLLVNDTTVANHFQDPALADLPDGVYDVVGNKALLPTDYDLRDFPGHSKKTALLKAAAAVPEDTRLRANAYLLVLRLRQRQAS